MCNQWTVLGGWAISPAILSSIFGNESYYVDINRHIDAVVNNSRLIPDWKDYFLSDLFQSFPRTRFLAGWSTGAIIAATLAPVIKPDLLVLFAPTKSFCKQPSFIHGLRPKILHSMISALEIDKIAVLEQFFANCGVDPIQQIEDYSVKELQNGLFFLLQAQLNNLSRLNCRTLCFHGTEDRIIPIGAGRELCREIGGSMHEFVGSHAFFQKTADEILTILSKELCIY